ncbi:hypothetical protein B7463_g4894, partial [Scytalidium lignicola]
MNTKLGAEYCDLCKAMIASIANATVSDPRLIGPHHNTTKSLLVSAAWGCGICEGHVEDWQKHVVEMGVIYTNCVPNIAVDNGESAEAGWFVSRDADSIRPCILELPQITQRSMDSSPGQKEPYPSSAYLLVDPYFFSTLMDTPLFGRGWVHQERLLSPRILHFGKAQLAWECSTLLACETFPVGFNNCFHLLKRPFSFYGGTSDQGYHVVQAYSTSSLTHSQNKLVAIAGIAKRVSIKRAIKYVAGLFYARGSFVEDSWRANDDPLSSTLLELGIP